MARVILVITGVKVSIFTIISLGTDDNHSIKTWLHHNACKTCELVADVFEIKKRIIKSIVCNHEDSNCCCRVLKRKSSIDSSEDTASKDNSATDLHEDLKCDENFYYRFDKRAGDIRYFCDVCVRHGSKTGKHYSDGGDWIVKGVSFKDKTARKKHYMKRHLISNQHKVSLANQMNDERYRSIRGLPTTEAAKKATENLCLVIQYMIDAGLPYAHISQVASLLDLLIPENIPNPIGNRHHSTKNVPDLILANHNASLTQIKEKLNTPSKFTKQIPRLAIAIDKGTAPFDASRQPIVASLVGENGELEEVVLSASRIFDSSSPGIVAHIKDNLKPIVDLRKIATLCTDSASNYTGCNSGTYLRLQVDQDFDPRIIYLPDLCHKMELFLSSVLPPWAKDTLHKSEQIYKNLSSHSILSTKLFTLTNYDKDLKFLPVSGVSETRYVEFMHSHIESILRNMSVFGKYLPLIIDEEISPRVRDQAESVLKIINSPHFISNLVFCNIVFIEAAKVEKIAQGRTFGPHDYDQVVKSFKNSLLSLQNDVPEFCHDLIKSGDFCHNFMYNKCQHVAQYSYKFHENDDKILIPQYKRWITQLLSHLEEYLGNPESIDVMIKFFDVNFSNLEEKIDQFRTLFSLFNINFYTCSIHCSGLNNCNCVPVQVKKFFNMKDLFIQFEKNKKMKYKEMFSYFLSKHIESDRKFNMTNILRIMETATLMKCNQSSTERINSVISNIVHGHFEHRYTNPEASPDMVNAICMLKSNFNMHSLNFKLARENFILEQHHREAFMSSKKILTKSKTIKKMEISMKNNSKVNKKRKTINLENKFIKKIKLCDTSLESTS